MSTCCDHADSETDHRQPEPSDLIDEPTQAVTVARNGMIVQPALHNTPQPATRFADRTMPTCPQLLFDLPKLNQSSLVLVQLQAKPGKPCVECFQTRGPLVRGPTELKNIGPNHLPY